MKILLVDDHNLFLDGMCSLLRINNIEVLGTANNGMEALSKTRQLKPDVIMMDVWMPDCNGLIATRLIKAEMPKVKIIMLTMSETEDTLYEAFKSGASGYLLKNLDGDEFVNMLRRVEKGELLLSPSIAKRFLNEFFQTFNQTSASSVESRQINSQLTPRQIEILTMAAEGMTYKEIGSTISLTERTIKYHMNEIITKLQLRNKNQAVAMARKAGLTFINRK